MIIYKSPCFRRAAFNQVNLKDNDARRLLLIIFTWLPSRLQETTIDMSRRNWANCYFLFSFIFAF